MVSTQTQFDTADQARSKKRGKLTVFLGGVLAFLGTTSAFLSGVDWNVLFSPEGAGLASAGVGLAGAAVIFVRAVVLITHKRV